MNMVRKSKEAGHPLDRIPPSLMGGSDGKFKAKLDFAERCSALAAVRAGIKKDVVAAAFGVDRRTISHMVNPYSKHYKQLRDEEKKLGPDEFKLRYFDEKTLIRIQKAALPIEKKEEAEVAGPNARSRAKAGIQVVRPEQCTYNHRLEIAFRTGQTPIGGTIVQEGWWYRDLDGPDPDEWCRGDDASLMTSVACLNYAKGNIYDA